MEVSNSNVTDLRALIMFVVDADKPFSAGQVAVATRWANAKFSELRLAIPALHWPWSL